MTKARHARGRPVTGLRAGPRTTGSTPRDLPPAWSTPGGHLVDLAGGLAGPAHLGRLRLPGHAPPCR